MFGYVNANRKGLSKQGQGDLQQYYCGLSRQLKLEGGLTGQMVLNWDMTILATFLTGLYGLEDEKVESLTCQNHPFRKCISNSNAAIQYAAKMSILLSYFDFPNSWAECRTGFSKKTYAKKMLKRHKQIEEEYPRQALAIKKYLMKLSVAERGNEKNLDVVAGLTGELMGEIYTWKEDKWKDELHTFGFYLGKYMYIMKVYDQLEKDKNQHLYNPLLCEHYIRSNRDFHTFVKLQLATITDECCRSFERLSFLKNREIIENILYSGVKEKYQDMVQKKEKKMVER